MAMCPRGLPSRWASRRPASSPPAGLSSAAAPPVVVRGSRLRRLPVSVRRPGRGADCGARGPLGRAARATAF
eukprot:4324449-Pleurochrysis_carterae.AAC.1